MNHSWMDPVYEAARTWALQPISRPPAGWAQLARGGIVHLAVQGLPEVLTTSLPEPPQRPTPSGLLMIVAAMIAEVCQ